MRHGLCCRSDRESAGLMCVMVCVVDLIGSQQVVSGETTIIPVTSQSDDVKTCYETVRDITQCVQTLENAHTAHLQVLERQTVLGSQ